MRFLFARVRFMRLPLSASVGSPLICKYSIILPWHGKCYYCELWSLFLTVSGQIEPMDELIHCSHRTVYTNQTIGWDPIEIERSEATILRRSWGDPKRHSPRVRAWSLWLVVQSVLVPIPSLKDSTMWRGNATLRWRRIQNRTFPFCHL